MIGKGYSIKSAKAEMNMVVEGYYATKNAFMLSKKLSTKFLIINFCYKILFENKSASRQMKELSKIYIEDLNCCKNRTSFSKCSYILNLIQ